MITKESILAHGIGKMLNSSANYIRRTGNQAVLNRLKFLKPKRPMFINLVSLALAHLLHLLLSMVG